MNEINNTQENAPQGFEIKKYLFLAISYWYLFVISVTISFFVAKWVNSHAIPTYGLHSTIMLKSESNEEEVAGGLTLFSKRKNLDTQIGILSSFSLSEEAIKTLEFETSYYRDERFKTNYEIYKKSPFVVVYDTLYSQYTGLPVYVEFLNKNEVLISIEKFEVSKKIKIGQTFKYNNFKFKILHRDSVKFNNNIIGNKYFFIKNNITGVIKSYLNRMKIEVSPQGSSILWLWLVGTVPQKDADFLNKLTELYIQKGLDEKNQKAASIIEFIDKQLEGVSDSLRKTESSMQIFKQQNGTIDISNEGMLLLNRLTELGNYKIQQKNKIAYYKYLQEQLLNNDGVTTITSPSIMNINDAVLLSYLDKYSELLTEREMLDYSVKNDIPISQKLDLQISNMQKQILNHANKNIEVATKDLENINRNIAKTNKDINKLPVSERRMINIERKFNINDELYTHLLKRRMEAAITQASNKADTRILDKARAELAEKKSPDTAGNKKKGIMFGFIIPILFIVILEFFNNKIEDKSDIESRTNIPIYGTVGKNKYKSKLPVIEHPKSPISESFRAIRTNLKYILKNKENKIIVVTSSISGEGKSFISSNLASVIALSDKKTLLVGLDLRKPKLQEIFDFDNKIGVSSYLVEHATYNEIIRKTQTNNLYVAMPGMVPPNPAELIESERMNLFFEKAIKEFDYVIVDTPPIAVVTDAMLLTEIADAYLYVMRQDYSSKNVIKLIEDAKKDNNIENLGIILNDIQIKRSFDYSHGYGYGYGYGYGQGYYDESDLEEKSLLKKILTPFKNK
ncbi:MAG: polysaccharide biosynthesis tyrosine autokinase [Chlorobi bacterium]|nr:polysaccharide biosynthesis tyrosine autokinase [Chlorobiota bacterium]